MPCPYNCDTTTLYRHLLNSYWNVGWNPGYANLPAAAGGLQDAIRENGVPGINAVSQPNASKYTSIYAVKPENRDAHLLYR
jgi:hypothetical protein